MVEGGIASCKPAYATRAAMRASTIVCKTVVYEDSLKFPMQANVLISTSMAVLFYRPVRVLRSPMVYCSQYRLLLLFSVAEKLRFHDKLPRDLH